MAEPLIILVTGANQGLGYFVCELLAKSRGYTILLGSRNIEKGEAAVEKIKAENSNILSALEAVQIDLSSDESINNAASLIGARYGRLDILLNNAGIAGAQKESDGTPSLRQLYHEHMDSNVIGHVLVTEAFLPLLRKSKQNGTKARIVFTTSILSSLTVSSKQRDEYGVTHPIYRVSKASLNMLVVYYANILRKEGVPVIACCPGHCATNLNQYQGFKDPRVGASAIVMAMELAERLELSGSFVSDDGVIPW